MCYLFQNYEHVFCKCTFLAAMCHLRCTLLLIQSLISLVSLLYYFFYKQPQRLSCCCATMVTRSPRVVVGLAVPRRGLPRLLPRLTALQSWCSLVLGYFSLVSFASPLEILYFRGTSATVSWLSLVPPLCQQPNRCLAVLMHV
jgi:hypothetical protein